jgi:hypothetical protein
MSRLILNCKIFFDSCIYTCHLIHRIPQAERRSLEKITSRMLEELYRYVPPVESKDTLRVRSNLRLTNHWLCCKAAFSE